jgi:hypothetical protein
MKPESRKLSLKRETLMPMNDEELVNVNGGTLGQLVKSAIKSAVQLSKWSSKGCASGAIVDSAIESYNQTRKLFSGK